MFPSSGYFKGVDCPFFLSGLCERPWCHFRHVKNDEQGTQKATTSSSYMEELGITPSKGTEPSQKQSSLLNMVGDAIQQVQRDIDKAKGAPVHRYMKYDFVKPNVGQAKYKPTPINKKTGKVELPPNHPCHLKVAAPRPKPPCPTMPEYHPTPIHLLKQRGAAPEKQQKVQNDYDPVSNFSTKQTLPLPPPSSRITLGNAGKDFVSMKRQTDAKDPAVIDKKRRRLTADEEEAKFSSDEDTEAKSVDSSKDSIFMKKTFTDSTENKTKSENSGDSKNEKNNLNGNETELVSNQEDISNNDKDVLKDEKSNVTKQENTCTCSSQNSSSKDRKNSSSKCEFCTANKIKSLDNSSETKTQKIDQRTDSTESDKSKAETSTKSNGKDSEKENDSKKQSHKDKDKSSRSKSSRSSDSHSKSSKNKHKHEHSSSSSRDKHKSSKDKHSSSKSSSSSSHKHKSADKDRTSHKSKSSKESSSRRNSSEKKSSSSKSVSVSKPQEKKTSPRVTNIFEAIFAPPVKLERSVSHAELFGNDSDTESKKESSSKKDSAFKDSDSEDSDFIEISSVSSNNSIKNALLTAEDFEFEDEDPYDECLCIFKEKQQPNSSTQPAVRPASPVVVEEEEDAAHGKVRVARANEERIKILKREASSKSKHGPSPAQVMHNRFMEMQKRAQDMIKNGKVGKKRVAHLPRPSQSSAKKPPTTSSAGNISSTKRVAHVPQPTVKLPRPVITKTFGNKVPVNVRQQYLNRLIDECQKIYDDDKDAFERGLAEENSVYERATSKMIYLNLSINAIKKLRDEAGKPMMSPTKSNPKAMSHSAVLGGKSAASCSFTLNRSGGPKKEPEKLEGVTLYKYLSKYILNEEQLVENGFPRKDADTGKTVIKPRYEKKRVSSDKLERLCIRCGKRFVILPTGQYKRREDCTHHWGKCWKKRMSGAIESYWTCCQGDSGSAGCQVAKYHVHEDNRSEDRSGFMQTLAGSPPAGGEYKVYAMDCEMVYTTAGNELARVTVIDGQCKPVLDQIVKPDNHVVDHNTRFSGLTKESLRGIKTSLRDIQAVLLSMFTANTILVGHSLESDLIAVKLIHTTVVDTSVVFPHRLGPPYKRALKNLASEVIDKIIQEDVGGHDSHEDAAAAMELMLHKVKGDAKQRSK